jgi:hypothetical protein
VLSASSDAAKWLIHNGDRVAALFQAVAPEAEVRLVLDSWFPPMLENEGRYSGAGGTSAFDGVYEPFSGTQLLPASVNPAATLGYGTDGVALVNAEVDAIARGVNLDDSCVAAHAADPVALPYCYDTLHILLNHVASPFFVVADQRDPVVSPNPHLAVDPTYRWSIQEYRRRDISQGEDLFALHDVASELATGADATGAAIGTWTPGLYLPRPDSPVHVYLGSDASFFGSAMKECNGAVGLGAHPLPEVLSDWVLGGTAYPAWERPGTGALNPHWVTAPHACNSPL